MRNIKFLMQAAGVSCLDLATALDVSQQAVYKWIAGKSMPRAEILPELARLLNCTIDALYGREPPQEPPGAAAS